MPADAAAGTYTTAAAMNGEGTAVVSDVRKRRLVAFSAETGKEVSIHEITGDGKVIEGTTISGTFYGAHKF